jgi:hypothetical protein
MIYCSPSIAVVQTIPVLKYTMIAVPAVNRESFNEQEKRIINV